MKALAALIFLALWSVIHGREETNGRFVALLLTRTHVNVATATVTVPVSCIASVNTAVPCGAKRRRRAVALVSHALEDDVLLSGSVDETPETVGRTGGTEGRQPHADLTLWSTVVSTHTSTITFTDTATTLSLIYECSVAGDAIPTTCN